MARPSSGSRTLGGSLRALIAFVGMSVIAGVLLTVGVTPALALTGISATNTIGLFQNLPGYLEVGTLMQKTNIYAGDGTTLLASFYDQNRVEVGWDQIAQSAKDAAVDAEDPRFYEHGGVDLQGTVRAIASTYVIGGDTQGGSSITQQYVKNVLVQKAEAITDEDARNAAYAEATATTPERKLKEMRLAIGLEKEYSKDDILLGYLNIALFGGTVYGIEAAANYYYGISASQLSIDQSASLMAIVNNPEKFRFDQPDNADNGAANGYAQTLERRNYILNAMHEQGSITAEETAAAAAQPISPNITQPSTGCATANGISGSGFFCQYVTYLLRSDPAFGATDDERYANLRRGGYDIVTTLDLDIQAAAKTSLDAYVPETDNRFDIGGSAVSVEAGTGRVLAMVQNKEFSEDPDVIATGAQYSAINLNVDADMGGGDGVQTGSTYKVFTLADWLSNGRTLNESFASPTSGFSSFPASCEGGAIVGTYSPVNDSASENASAMTALQATTNSINTGFMGMAHQLDLCDIRSTAEAFGVHRADGAELVDYPSSVLGVNEIAPLTMAVAYAGIANDGTTCTPVAIDKITDSSGNVVTPPASSCTASVTADVAHGMQYAMQRVMTSGTGVSSNPNDGIQHIGKTGTTDYAADVWTAGASKKASLAVWVGSIKGFDDGSKMNLRTISITGDSGTVSAATSRHAIWKPIMTAIDNKYGGDDFAAPPAAMLASSSGRATSTTVPDVSGDTVAEATSRLTDRGFTIGSASQVDSTLPAGQVVATSPAAGTAAQSGAAISLQVSTGTAPGGTAPGGTATPVPTATSTAAPAG
ncbi:transglycosylase domain-containing protein [Microbacteriaceae bacterium VKM Ac-2854]|nr:transglycosylase domain-containing protein [Microbacteriaceae bacterium VKM Ac-2854]